MSSLDHGKYPRLLEPGSLGALNLRNRVLLSSLTRNRSDPDANPNTDNLEYYRQRAKGGMGLIFSEGTLIAPQGSEWPNAPGIWSQEHVDAWKPIVDAVHEEGCQFVCQLWHLGRQNRYDLPLQVASGEPVWAPSAVRARGGKFRMLPLEPGYPRPTPLHHPEHVLDQYEKAAEFAKQAGFDGVELHAANGYLCEQFLSDVSNERTDRWGGSQENRARFTLGALDHILKVWPADRVGIKLTPSGGYGDSYFTSTTELVATFRYLIEQLEKLDLAWIQLVNYDIHMDPHHGGVPQGYKHDVLATYGDLIKTRKIVANSGYNAESAEAELAKPDTKVYAVSFGKAALANPDLPMRFAKGAELNDPVPKTFYTSDGGANTNGYTDYPFLSAVA